MTRNFLCLVSFLAISNLLYSSNDTVKIIFFQDSNIQQYRGVEWHRISKYIPSGTYKKAQLQIDLGCASYGCCAWDYTYRGFFSKRVTDSSFEDIEVARLITPYSSFMRKAKYGFDSTWSHPYIYDVTDYIPLLQDSIMYSANTGGWDDKGKFGFKQSVTLLLIKGEPNTQSTRILPLHENSYPYIDSTQFEQLIPAKKFSLKESEKYAKYRMIFTGHNQEGEFSPIQFYLKVNGKPIYDKRMWKNDCDQNAIQPQSGTWIFSRCNWCPGEKVEEVEVDISPYLKEGTNTLDISLGKIETKDTPIHASYSISGNLILYAVKPEYDAELIDIVSPNIDKRFSPYNPSCQSAIVRVKNRGSSSIRNLHFEYFTLFGKIRKHSWQGRLDPEEIMDIALPMHWESSDLISRKFYIKMIRSLQNRSGDLDNLSSSYKPAPIMKSSQPSFELSSTNDSTINTLIITNDSNHVIFRKNYFNNSQTYRDTPNLPAGSYKLELLDRDPRFECGDGLSFWYSSKAYHKSSGIFKIYNNHSGKLLKVFNPDFGGKISYQFIIDK